MKRILIDYRVTKKEDCVENFTLRNLDSVYVVDKNNIMTRSIILGPNNTDINNKSHKYENVSRTQRGTVHFNQKAEKETTLKSFFGQSNTSVISFLGDKSHYKITQEEQEVTVHKEIPLQNNNILFAPNTIDLNKNFEMAYNENNHDNVALQNHYETIDLDNSFYNDKKTKKVNNTDRLKQNAIQINHYNYSTTSFNDSIISQMEELGYTRDYILHSLRNNDLNYCTACYYLLMKPVEKIDFGDLKI